MIHNAVVTNRKIYLKHPRFVQGGINADELVIFADEEWDECTTILVTFTHESDDISPVTYLLPGLGKPANVPKSVLEEAGDLYISLTGYVGEEKRITTEKMSHVYCAKVFKSGVIANNGEDSHPDDTDYLASLIQEVNDIIDYLEEIGVAGANDYMQLQNRPQIEGILLEGNKLMSEFGIGSLSETDIDEATNTY